MRYSTIRAAYRRYQPNFGLLLGVIAFAGWGIVAPFGVPPAQAGTTCLQVSSTRKVCHVDQPAVATPSHAYPEIRYAPGDVITVDAGGCVQTGGSGKTWKRYVNPLGSNSGRLYHGLIWLPGATNGLQRIGVVHQAFNVANDISPAQTYLRVGYEDDDYGDNGYWGHDDGTGDQCKNIGPAFLVLTIDHSVTPVATPAPLPLDLVPDGFDDNGLARNPSWSYQAGGGPLRNVADLCHDRTIRQCTNAPVGFDTPGFLKEAVPFLCTAVSAESPSSWVKLFSKEGHTNWSTGTFYGSIFFNEHSGSDDDYDLSLIPQSGTATPLTAENTFVAPGTSSHGSHVEFDSDETIDHFHTAWWSAWHNAVDNDDSKAHALVDGSDAVVVGLVGLDCVHDCLSEIHPVYAMAIRVPTHPAGVDRWALFVRNSGNEGFCSQNQHYLETPQIALRLHAPAGADTFSLAGSDVKTNDAAMSLAVDADGQDALVVVNMPVTANMERLNGTIDLLWHTRIMSTRSAHLGPRAVVRPNSSLMSPTPVYLASGSNRYNRVRPIRDSEPDATGEVRLAAAVGRLPYSTRAALASGAASEDTTLIVHQTPGTLQQFRLHHRPPNEVVRVNQGVEKHYIARLDLLCRTLPAVELVSAGISADQCSAVHQRFAYPEAAGVRPTPRPGYRYRRRRAPFAPPPTPAPIASPY